MRKSSVPRSHYRKTPLRHTDRLRRFERQMADFARAERLRSLRESRHLSQEDAAHEIGVSVKTVRSWEQGGGIRWPNAKRAAKVYGVDPESLVVREDGSGVAADVETISPGQLEKILAGQERLSQQVAKLATAVDALQPDQERTRRSPASRRVSAKRRGS